MLAFKTGDQIDAEMASGTTFLVLFSVSVFLCHVKTLPSSSNSIKIYTFRGGWRLHIEKEIIASFTKASSKLRCAIKCALNIGFQSFAFYRESSECKCYGDINARVITGRLVFIYQKKVTADMCPTQKGFRRLEPGGLCIKFKISSKNWSKAQKICESEAAGSHLAILDTRKKNVQVAQAGGTMKRKFHTGVYIGLHKVGFSSPLTWVNGKKLSYGHWTEQRFSGNCVYMYRRRHWTWALDHCNKRKHFLCEIS